MSAASLQKGSPRALKSVMDELKELGTAQNVKIYRRHGVCGPVFGVSFANLGKLKKIIKTDHVLARKLWATKNFDARNLATMIAVPEALSSKELDVWAKDLDSHALSDVFVKMVAGSHLAKKKAVAWRKRKAEWIARSGWMLVAHIAMRGESKDKVWIAPLIGEIERTIHSAQNRVRDAMNYALIAVGGTFPSLRRPCLQSAKRIGKVQVDHGETGCKTRDATDYIESMWARKKAKPAQPSGKSSVAKKPPTKKLRS